MLKRMYTYFYCAECKIREGEFAKVSSVVNAYQKININNFAKVRREIEKDVARLVKERYDVYPMEFVISALSFLHENDEGTSLTLLSGNAEDE